MPNYSEINGRADLTDAMLPDQIISDIIQEAPTSSVLMSRARNVRLSAKKAKQPVLATLPDAYWVDGDTGMKQTSKPTWKGVNITAEELAVIVPVPDALVDDANIPLWETVKPLLVEAIGKKIDAAGLFGTDKPDSWPEAAIPAAIAAGNTVARGTGSDLGADVALLGQKLSQQGFGINGFAVKPGMQWELVGLRNAQGDPIYTQTLSGTPASGLYGFPLNEVNNGVWDETVADLLAADWSKFVIGVRQDITYDLFREGVISDDEGKVVLNLMQQDCKALRVVFRVGFQVAVPATRLGGKYPAGVITPANAVAAAHISPEQIRAYSTDVSTSDSGDLQGTDDPSTGDGASDVTDAGATPLEKMTKTQLADYAEEHSIDLSGCSSKADMLDAIAEAE